MSIPTSFPIQTTVTATTTNRRDTYLKQLLAAVQTAVPEKLPLADLRSRAEALVKEQGFPSTRQEAWRFTNLDSMLAVPFVASQAAEDASALAARLEAVRIPEAGARLALVNGCYSPELSELGALPEGVAIGPLSELWADTALRSRLESRLGNASGGHEMFTALNTVGFQEALVVWVPRGVEVVPAIHLLNVSLPQAKAAIAQPRILVIAEANSALTLVEDFWGANSGDHFTNAVSELWLDENAHLEHLRIQRESVDTCHIAKTAATQARDSSYRCTAVSLGAAVSRHHLEVYQTGAQTDTQLYSLTAISGDQLSDTQSLVALNHPHGNADQLHKTLVDDRAHSVFSGRIVVPHAAQLTNASQLNRNLLLSDKGRVNTKPQLEIVADNVKCAHGATVSQLQADEIFYLQSRGIDAKQAQRLLIYAFAMEILDRIFLESLRLQLIEPIHQLTG